MKNTYLIFQSNGALFCSIELDTSIHGNESIISGYESDGFTVVKADGEYNGKLLMYSADEGVVVLPDKPSNLHSFDYQVREWVIDVSAAQQEVTQKRNALLQDSDWTQLPDVPIATKEAWAIYRQALRDITDQPGYPTNITWPTPPN